MMYVDWLEQAKAKQVIQDPADRELLEVETYDLIVGSCDPHMEPQGMFGNYVTIEAFQALADRFVLAWELIKIMEEQP